MVVASPPQHHQGLACTGQDCLDCSVCLFVWVMAQEPDHIARFRNYNDYLDSLKAEEDIRYLQEGELAR